MVPSVSAEAAAVSRLCESTRGSPSPRSTLRALRKPAFSVLSVLSLWSTFAREWMVHAHFARRRREEVSVGLGIRTALDRYGLAQGGWTYSLIFSRCLFSSMNFLIWSASESSFSPLLLVEGTENRPR